MNDSMIEAPEREPESGLASKLLHAAKQSITSLLATTEAKLAQEAATLRSQAAVLEQASHLLESVATGRQNVKDVESALRQTVVDSEGHRLERQVADEFAALKDVSPATLAQLHRYQTLRSLAPLIKERAQVLLVDNHVGAYLALFDQHRAVLQKHGFPAKP